MSDAKIRVTQDGWNYLLEGKLKVEDNILFVDNFRMERDGDEIKFSFWSDGKKMLELCEPMHLPDGWSAELVGSAEFRVSVKYV